MDKLTQRDCAKVLARAHGLSTEQVAREIELALERRSVKLLDNLGVHCEYMEHLSHDEWVTVAQRKVAELVRELKERGYA